jgi:hypothetical protein
MSGLAFVLALLAAVAGWFAIELWNDRRERRERKEFEVWQAQRTAAFLDEMRHAARRHLERPAPTCSCALEPYGASDWSTVSRLCPKHRRGAS